MSKLLEVLHLRSFGEKIWRDVIDSGWYIAVGILAGALVTLMWVVIMRFVAAVMVWASIILSVLLLGTYIPFLSNIFEKYLTFF